MGISGKILDNDECMEGMEFYGDRYPFIFEDAS